MYLAKYWVPWLLVFFEVEMKQKMKKKLQVVFG
jgi:hypothetical protein